MPFQFNGDGILPCEGLVKFNGVNVRELQFNGVLVHNGIWPPGPATGLDATDTNCEEIVITWMDPVDPGSGTYIYNLYENGALLASNVTSPYTHTVRQSTPRTYHVTSVGSDCPDPKLSNVDDGNSHWRSDAVTNFVASNIGCAAISCSWTNATEDGYPNATYDLYDNGVLVATDITSPYDFPSVDQTPRNFHVKSVNHCASVPSNNDIGQIATDPVPVTNFSASDGQCEKITVTWSHELMTAQYNLYQGTTLIAANVSSGYVITNIKQEAGIPYHVEQVGHCGANAVSNTNNGSSDWKPEAAPTNFAASNNDQSIIGRVRCTWTNVSAGNNGSPNCTYDVYAGATRVGQNVSSGFLHNTSYDGNTSYTVRAVNGCGSRTSNADIGNAYQKAAPKTTTFYSSGTCVLGVGHTLADVCVVGGGGGGGYRPSDNEHRGGGGAGGANSQANISNTSNFAVTIGSGGSGLGGGALGGYNGYPTSALGVSGSGGSAGASNALIYYGQGAASPGVCGFPGARDGHASSFSGDRSGGGQGRVGNGGGGEGVGGGPGGGTAAGGGGGYGIYTSGAGGNGIAIITTK